MGQKGIEENLYGRHPTRRGSLIAPDYTEDLNAMHEAEKVLNQKQKEDYFFIILNFYGNWPKAIQATADQRAEAFLRAVGKWEGE
jgi:hypothetical protein